MSARYDPPLLFPHVYVCIACFLRFWDQIIDAFSVPLSMQQTMMTLVVVCMLAYAQARVRDARLILQTHAVARACLLYGDNPTRSERYGGERSMHARKQSPASARGASRPGV